MSHPDVMEINALIKAMSQNWCKNALDYIILYVFLIILKIFSRFAIKLHVLFTSFYKKLHFARGRKRLDY